MTPNPSPEMKKTIKPILPIKDFEDILIQLRADPRCKVCFGRGYVSFSANAQGGKTMNLCGCADFGETELLKVLRSIGLVAHAVNSLGAAMSEALARIEKSQAETRSEIEQVQARLFRANAIRRMFEAVKNYVKKVNEEKERSERKDEPCQAE